MTAIRLPDPNALALLASRAAIDVDLAQHAGVTGHRVRELATVLEGLARQGGNFGPWLSPAGAAVQEAIFTTAGRPILTTSELSEELRRVASTYAKTADVLEQLGNVKSFSLALSHAALHESAVR